MPNVVVSDLADAAVITLFFSSIAFIIGYSVRAPWWRYLVGRAMASLDIALVITLGPATFQLVTGVQLNITFSDWYGIVSMFIVAGVILWRLWTIWHVNHERDGDTEEAPTTDLVKETR